MSTPVRPILVVDDDADLVDLAVRVLRHRGWVVEGTSDPRAAIALVETLDPCLVIFDLMMPHLDGEEFVRLLRTRAGERRLPPLALVSAAYTRAELARDLGVDATLSKPFDLDDLVDLAVRFAAEHRLRDSTAPPASR